MPSDFRQFLKDNFNLSTEQSSYLDSFPDEVLNTIGKNLAHALDNNYSVSFDINRFSNAFSSVLMSFTPPTWGTSRLRCRIGHWTTHQGSNCGVENHWGISCSMD